MSWAEKLQCYPQGDSALLLYGGEQIDESLNNYLIACARQLKKIPGVIDTTVAYSSLTVLFEPLQISYQQLCDSVAELIQTELAIAQEMGRLVRIPVCYHPSLAPDLPALADHCGLSIDEVIRRHCQPTYRVYCLGFMPGFLYLGGLDPALACPRHSTPRVEIEAGSVGIAGNQTGIYPMSSPGGWQLIGRTPLTLFDHNRQPPTLASPGDQLEFYPISLEQYYDRA